MSPINQLTFGPTPAHKVGGPLNPSGPMPSAANLVSSVDLASIVLKAGARMGLQNKELASVFGLSEADFSAAFSPNRPDRNRPMKVVLPCDLARAIALSLCEATGLAVCGPDAERHALADLLTKCADYIRVMGAGR